MTLPPVPDLPEDARPWFRQLRDRRDGWLAAGATLLLLPLGRCLLAPLALEWNRHR